ncbi:hypothetical protein EGW08_015196, partial [Elysia chlorotica]
YLSYLIFLPPSSSVSVATSCFTLVAISLERYFAICHPLKSRRWQTLSHSYKAIAVCWVCALALSVPIAIHHIGTTGRHSCREIWPSVESEKAYTVALDLLLLVLPVLIMTWAYGCVSYTLWIGMKLEKKTEKGGRLEGLYNFPLVGAGFSADALDGVRTCADEERWMDDISDWLQKMPSEAGRVGQDA